MEDKDWIWMKGWDYKKVGEDWEDKVGDPIYLPQRYFLSPHFSCTWGRIPQVPCEEKEYKIP